MSIAVRPMKTTLRTIAICLSLICATTHAADSDGLSDLLRNHQYEAALARTNSILEQRPHDAAARLVKGYALSELGRTDESIAAYNTLIDEYPGMAEPYNNLAVLLAASGQYDKARAALETAIKINPKYTVAQENLGDLYAKMAIRAYAKVSQLDPSNTSAKLKVSEMHSSFANTEGTVSHPPAEAANTGVTAVVKTMSDTGNKSTNTVRTITGTNAATIQTTNDSGAKSTTTVALAGKTDKAAPAPTSDGTTPNPNAKGGFDRTQVLQVVQGWADAWSGRDVKTYLGFYASEFKTPDGESRTSWEATRRARITGKNHIQVSINTPTVNFTEKTAIVTFQQIYIADNIKQENRKVLLLTRHDDTWKIVQELVEK